MRGDATKYGCVAVCSVCDARFAAATREEALALLDGHETRAGCRRLLVAAP